MKLDITSIADLNPVGKKHGMRTHARQREVKREKKKEISQGVHKVSKDQADT
jgi:hypothetical protein